MSDKPFKLVEKINTERNSKFIPAVEADLAALKNGQAVSMTVFTRYANGDTKLVRSYSQEPQHDAGEMLAMALDRLGFSRE